MGQQDSRSLQGKRCCAFCHKSCQIGRDSKNLFKVSRNLLPRFLDILKACLIEAKLSAVAIKSNDWLITKLTRCKLSLSLGRLRRVHVHDIITCMQQATWASITCLVMEYNRCIAIALVRTSVQYPYNWQWKLAEYSPNYAIAYPLKINPHITMDKSSLNQRPCHALFFAPQPFKYAFEGVFAYRANVTHICNQQNSSANQQRGVMHLETASAGNLAVGGTSRGFLKRTIKACFLKPKLKTSWRPCIVIKDLWRYPKGRIAFPVFFWHA